MNNTQEKTDTTKSIHTITNALLEDLFNPSISTLDLCNLHDISLPELAATLESETFKQAKSAFERRVPCWWRLRHLHVFRPAHASHEQGTPITLPNPPFERINAARQHIIDAEASALATARLADIPNDRQPS